MFYASWAEIDVNKMQSHSLAQRRCSLVIRNWKMQLIRVRDSLAYICPRENCFLWLIKSAVLALMTVRTSNYYGLSQRSCVYFLPLGIFALCHTESGRFPLSFPPALTWWFIFCHFSSVRNLS